MAVAYNTALTRKYKQPVWVLSFDDLSSTRWCSTKSYEYLTSTAYYGLEVIDDLSTDLDLRTGELAFGEVRVRLREDTSGTVANFLGTNDDSLLGTTVTLKHGLATVDESNFQERRLQLIDWSRSAEGYVLHLASALRFLDRPLFEDIKDDGFTLAIDLPSSETATVSVGGDLGEAAWPTSGYMLLTDGDTRETELIQYSSYSIFSATRTDVTISSRRALNVGAVGKNFFANRTKTARAWAIKDDPMSVFLRLATTTAAGTNGTWDAGDGDGLGDYVSVDAIDSLTFTNAANTYLAGPGGTPLDALFVGIDPIESLQDFFQEEFLAMGFYLGINTRGKLTIRPLVDLEDSAADLVGKLDVRRILPWRRAYNEAENQVVWKWDYNPGDDYFFKVVDGQHASAQSKYGKSKLREVRSRGARGIQGTSFGWPDLDWDLHMDDKACDYMTELANPSLPVKVVGFLEAQDTEVGDLVTITHAGLFSLEDNALSVTEGLFYVVGVERSPSDGQVELILQKRRHVGRPWFIAPNYNREEYKINFTVDGAETYQDYQNASKAVLYPTAGYGVNGTGSVGWTASVGDGDRDRDDVASPSELHDSLSFGTNATGSERVFQLSLSNATYLVKVGLGDNQVQTDQRIYVNGASYWDSTDISAYEYLEQEQEISVTTGVMSVQIGGGGGAGNTVINWLEIRSQSDYNDATEAEKQYGFIPPDSGNFTSDNGAPYDTGI